MPDQQDINKKGSIYRVTFRNDCSSNGYVGKTKNDDPKTRIEQHIADMKNGSNTDFHKAIRKFGEDNIEVEWIRYKDVNIGSLTNMENHYIDKYDTRNNGYNMRGGNNSKQIESEPAYRIDPKSNISTLLENIVKIEKIINEMVNELHDTVWLHSMPEDRINNQYIHKNCLVATITELAKQLNTVEKWTEYQPPSLIDKEIGVIEGGAEYLLELFADSILYPKNKYINFARAVEKRKGMIVQLKVIADCLGIEKRWRDE